VRSSLGATGDAEPDTLPEWFIQGKGEHAVVDEHPRVRLRYVDVQGKKHECTLQVDHLDVQKKTLSGHGELPGDVRRFPLHRIVSARIADSGQRFNVDTWVEAVRVARRRRG
jgi:predicted DNA-binding transcriptional regulator YafY